MIHEIDVFCWRLDDDHTSARVLYTRNAARSHSGPFSFEPFATEVQAKG